MSQGNGASAGSGAAFKVHSNAAGRTGNRKPRRNGPVEISRLSPLAEELALFLCDGDRSRLRIVSVSIVIVENRPRGRKS